MFTTADDFAIPPYELPSMVGNNTFAPFIEQQEKEALRHILGSELYALFIAGLTELESDETPEEKWLNLRDGATYFFRDGLYVWDGMKDLLVPYIHYTWLTYDHSQSSRIGTVKGLSENSLSINPGDKIIASNVAYVEKVGDKCNYKDTLYGFLLSSTNYPELRFKKPLKVGYL